MNIFIKNIGQLVTVASHGQRVKTGAAMRDLHILYNASILIKEGIIVSIGGPELIPDPEIDVLDAEGKVVLPGFVDSHTHTVFAGSRMNLQCELKERHISRSRKLGEVFFPRCVQPAKQRREIYIAPLSAV